MCRRSLLAVVILVAALAAHANAAPGAEIVAQLFPLTGEVRLMNRDASPIPFVYYSITSAGHALDGSSDVWLSIADNYDVSGNGLIDPEHEWFELSDDPDELTEGVFTGPGGSLPATRAISLGKIWDPFAVPFPDLAFEFWDEEQPIPVSVELAIDGDYTLDQVVDQADYVLWRRYVDSITMLLADGDLNGVVDDGDYLVWQGNFGISLPLPPYGMGGGSHSTSLRGASAGIPEPGSFALVAGLLISWAAFARRGRR